MEVKLVDICGDLLKELDCLVCSLGFKISDVHVAWLHGSYMCAAKREILGRDLF